MEQEGSGRGTSYKLNKETKSVLELLKPLKKFLSRGFN
jgi:hypothetical protein